jgi:hypothetical protein
MKSSPVGLIALSLLVAGCGGGGGSTFGGGAPVVTSFPINGSNGVAVTQLSWEAVVASGGLADLGGAAGLSGNAPNGSAIAERAARDGGLLFDVISMVPFGPDTFPCEGGTGSVTVSGDLAVPGTFTPGDTFLIVYELCDEGFGEVIDGTVALTVRDFAGDIFLGTYLLGMDADVDTLSVATATDTIVGSGDAAITLDTTETPYIEARVGGSVMTQDSLGSSETLRNYSSSQTFDGNLSPAVYTMEASGTLESSQLPGDVVYSTETTFQGNEGEYPNTGVLLVSGDNSSARLVAVDATNVRIEIDNNGDGTADEIIELTWAELEAG